MHCKFVKRFLLFSLLVILVVISINYFVDPFNIHQVIPIKGFNHTKSETQRRLTAALNTIRYKPKTIVLGTSRATRIGQEGLGNSCEGSFYNACFAGAGFDEMYAYFLHALYLQPDLKRVIVAIDLFSFNANRNPQVDFKMERLQRNSYELNDLKEVLFSYKALSESCKSVFFSFFEIKIKNSILETGEEKYLQQLLNTEENYKNYQLDPEKIKKFQSLAEMCKTRSIDLHVFVCPVKAQYWEFYYQNGLWSHVENLKRQLCAIHPLWDFSGYNPITLETLETEGEELYHDCSHFTLYTGSLLVKRMFGQTSSIDSVGYLLSPQTVESALADILEQRSRWLQNK